MSYTHRHVNWGLASLGLDGRALVQAVGSVPDRNHGHVALRTSALLEAWSFREGRQWRKRPSPTLQAVLYSFMWWSVKVCSQAGTEERLKKTKVCYTPGPRNKRHSMPCRATWGALRVVGRQKTGARENWG